MKIYIDKQYITPDIIEQVDPEMQPKLKWLFFTEENIEKLKKRCNNDIYQAIVFDTSPKESFLYMFPSDLSYDEAQEDSQSILEYKPEGNTTIHNSIAKILLAQNDFSIDPEEGEDD